MNGASPLDREIHVTIFDDVSAVYKTPELVSLRALIPRLQHTQAAEKKKLPLIKLASFGSHKTARNSYRHDGNLREIWGLELDYDAQKVTPERLADALRQHNLAAVVATTPSHTDDAPRCRLLLPLSRPREPSERARLISRVAGILPGPVAPESWNASQSFYVGHLSGATQHRVIVVEGTDFADLRPDLDSSATPKPPPVKRAAARKPRARKPNGAGPEQGDLLPDMDAPVNVLAALSALGAADPGLHDVLVTLCGRFAAMDVPKTVAAAALQIAFERRPEAERDGRWADRRGEISRTLDWAYEREQQARAGGGAPPPPPPPPPPTPTPAAGAAGPGPDLDLDSSIPPAYSDDALALGFAERFCDRLRYIAAWARWYAWDGAVWREDDTLRIFSRIRLYLRQLAATCPKHTIALALCDARTVAAVERSGRNDRRIAAVVQQWDRNPRLLNTPTGTVDLLTGLMQPHRAEDYASKITAVAPGGDCPLWHKFLDRITASDKHLQAFLQRVSGYCLTGLTEEHALFFAFGPGANGKGVFIGTLAGVMGSYAAHAAMETFQATPNDKHSCDLAMLRGARLVCAQETEDGRRWAEARVKTMTGGDPITARFQRQDFFTYQPAFKLLIAGNHKPGLRSVDMAIRRRLHLILFGVTIPLGERDRKLARRLKPEWPGILAWAIAGCLEWQRSGLAPPAAVTTATEEYLAGEDVIQTWIDECCIADRSKETYRSTLYGSYKAWAELAGEYVLSERRFATHLVDGCRYGQRQEKRNGTYRDQKIITGLTLKSGAGMVPP